MDNNKIHIYKHHRIINGHDFDIITCNNNGIVHNLQKRNIAVLKKWWRKT